MPGNTMGHIPYVRWWVDDWIAGTRFMSRVERDCYHELLMAQVSFKGKIPSDMIKQVMGDEYESVWPKIRHKFVEKNGFFFSKKMMEEIQRIKDYSQSRSRNRKNKKKLQKKDMKNISKTHEKDMGSGSGSDIDIKKEGECEGESSGTKMGYVPNVPNEEIKRKRPGTMHKWGEHQNVKITDIEQERLVAEHGARVTEAAIRAVDEYLETTGKRYKNHNLVLKKWGIRAGKEQCGQPEPREGFLNSAAHRKITDEEIFGYAR